MSLEQPTNATSWLENFVQSFLSEIQASLVVIPACSVGQDLVKSWLFATSFQGLQSLAAKCTHGNTHVQVAGIQDAQGHFLSQRTAEYPAGLASKFCLQVAPLFNDGLKPGGVAGQPPVAISCPLLHSGFCFAVYPAQTQVSSAVWCSGRRGHLLTSRLVLRPSLCRGPVTGAKKGVAAVASRKACASSTLSACFGTPGRTHFSLRQRQHG